MPTELYENLEAPKKAVLAAVDTGEYDVGNLAGGAAGAGQNGRLPGGGHRYPKAAKVLWRPPWRAAADCWS